MLNANIPQIMISLLISIHIGSEISFLRTILVSGDALIVEEIHEVRHEGVADLSVHFRRNVGSRDFPHTGYAIVIAAGKVIEVVGTTFEEERWEDLRRLARKVEVEKYLF